MLFKHQNVTLYALILSVMTFINNIFQIVSPIYFIKISLSVYRQENKNNEDFFV